MYNLIYARNDCEKGYIAYNSFSGALALMSEEEFHEYTDFSNGENGKLSNICEMQCFDLQCFMSTARVSC